MAGITYYTYNRDSSKDIILDTTKYISNLSDGTNTYVIKDAEARTSIASKQDNLVSGTNIKTINNNSILGSGNISVETSIDNTTITKNGSNNLQSVATIDNRSGNAIKTWTGTRAQYDAIITKDSNTLYNITDDTDVTSTVLEALYPVGAIYIGTMEVCPLTVLGIGTWAKVSEGRVLQGSDNGHNAGTTIEAGLPNITATGIAYEGSISPTGAVYKTSGGSCPSSTYQVRSTWNFDASLSNPIYGNSTTVQPSAFVVNIWKRIA